MGLLTREQVHSALAKQAELRTKGINTPIGEILLDMRLITNQQRDAALSMQIGTSSDTAVKSARITAETCPHYLLFNDTSVERLGPAAKCSPPIRDEFSREILIAHLCKGHFTSVGSDHSPAPATLKTSSDFFDIWGGISSIQLTLRLLLSLQLQTHELDFTTISRVLAANVATLFRLPAKGKIAQGYDADCTLVDVTQSTPLTRNELLDRHKDSPYLGQTLRGQIRQTILRGTPIYSQGKTLSPANGRFVRPVRV
jgi:allantoinase